MPKNKDLQAVAQTLRESIVTGKPCKFPIMTIGQMQQLSEILRNLE